MQVSNSGAGDLRELALFVVDAIGRFLHRLSFPKSHNQRTAGSSPRGIVCLTMYANTLPVP